MNNKFIMPERYRITTGEFATNPGEAQGIFVIPLKEKTISLFATCMVSSGFGWEHVSVTITKGRIPLLPTWSQMCEIKDLFWESEACVVQYHPAKSEYVNNHPTCLHLWRPNLETNPHTIPRPPAYLVGVPNK